MKHATIFAIVNFIILCNTILKDNRMYHTYNDLEFPEK